MNTLYDMLVIVMLSGQLDSALLQTHCVHESGSALTLQNAHLKSLSIALIQFNFICTMLWLIELYRNLNECLDC